MNSECGHPNFNTLKRYFENKAGEEEREAVEKWLENPETSLKKESCIRMLWNEMDRGSVQADENFDLLLDRIHHTINLRKKKEMAGPSEGRSGTGAGFIHVLKIVSRIAAVLLLPLAIYIAWEFTGQQRWMNRQQEELVYNEIICPLGARSEFRLPDGSTGSLNNGSRLKYPVRFSGRTREVELTGEAYFDVAKDVKRPFMIRTVGLDVKVLGTRLNVYSYPGEGYQEFTLESGTVELIKKDRTGETTIARMNPGQHLVYSFKDEVAGKKPLRSDRNPEVIRNQEELEEFLDKTNPGKHATFKMKEGGLDIIMDDAEYYTAWKDGKLVLRKDPMPRLLKRIERWYNVKFNILDKSIEEFTYWATFEEENLDQVLNLLSLTGPIRFEKKVREKMEDGTYQVQEIDVMLKH